MREIKLRTWNGKKMNYDDRDLSVWNGILVPEGDDMIMQFTGLMDKNGKEIYEGDYVILTKQENIGTFNVPDEVIANRGVIGEDIFEGEVIFNEFGFGINDKEHGIIYLQKDADSFFEIIGNIYENPKLLKEE